MFGSLPFLGNELTSDSGSQAPPGAGPRTQPEPQPQADPYAEIQRLMQMLEQPQPKPLTRTQQIGAGLMRLGQGLAGGNPSMQSGAEMDYARQAQQATEQNTQTRRGLIGDEVRRRQQSADDTHKRELDQQETMRREKAIADRQAALDAQNERQADHAGALEHMFTLMKDGFELPPGENIAGLTKDRMLRLANEYFMTKKGLPAQDAGVMAGVGTLINEGKARITSATEQIPGGGSRTATAVANEKPTIDVAPLSPTTGRQIADLGGQITPGMTEMEGINLKGQLDKSKLEQEAKDRQARLNKTGMGRGGNSVMKEIVALNKMRRSAQAAIDMQEESGRTLGGQYGQGGLGSKGMLALSDTLMGSDFLAKRVDYESLLSNAIRGDLFGDAGKNLTEVELKVMAASAPPDMIGMREDVQVNMLKRLRDNALQAIIDRKKMYGLSNDDVDNLMYGDSIQSPLLPGMVINPVTVNEAGH